MSEPNTLAPLVISREQIVNFLSLQEAHQALRKRLKSIEDSMKNTESQIIDGIQSGANVSFCGYDVSIQTIERRYPAWKEEFIARLGKQTADSVYESTAPRTYRSLVVKE